MKPIAIIICSLLLSGCAMFNTQQDKYLKTVLTSDVSIDCKVGFTKGVYVGETVNLKRAMQLEAIEKFANKDSQEYKDCFVNGVQLNIAGSEFYDKVMKCVGSVCRLVK